MTKSVRMIIGLAAGLILIAGGFALGHFWNKRTQAPTHTEIVATSVATVPAEKAPTPNTGTYNVSAPSKGRAYLSVPVTFENISGAQAVMFLKKDQAQDVKSGQNILLYDENGEVLDAVGKVVALDAGRDGFADYISISMAIPPFADKNAPKPSRGEIVTHDMKKVNRLPLSALRYGDKNEPYIWEGVRNDDSPPQTEAMKRFITGVQKIRNDFFIMDTPNNYVSNIYILNPDDALEHGQTVTVTETLYSPGVQPDDEQIADRPRNAYKKDTPLEPYEGETDSGACSTSCGGAEGADDFIAKIKSLAAEKAQSDTP